MRIGFFTDSYLPRTDGIAISIETYRAGLEALGHEVYVFCPDHPKKMKEHSKRIYRFKSIPSIAYDSYRDTFPFLPHRAAFIASLKLDLVHTFSQTQIGLLGMAIARREHIPLIATCNTDFDVVHEYPLMPLVTPFLGIGIAIASRRLFSAHDIRHSHLARSKKDNVMQHTAKAAAAYYFNQSDLVMVQSEKIKKAIGTYIRKPLLILPVGTDLNAIPKHIDVPKVRSNYHLPSDRLLFVSSCRLVKEKRVDFLIFAYAALPEADQKRSALVIVGTGRDKERLERIAANIHLEKDIIFTGLVPHEEVLKVVSACDVYVHASLRETQGLVLNEAAGCGKPLIMVDRDVNRVLQDGVNGFFAKESVKDFSDKMHELLSNEKLRTAFGIQSRELAKETSQEVVSKKLEEVYEKILSDK